MCDDILLGGRYLDVVWTETPAFFPHVGKPTWGGDASSFSALQYHYTLNSPPCLHHTHEHNLHNA